MPIELERQVRAVTRITISRHGEVVSAVTVIVILHRRGVRASSACLSAMHSFRGGPKAGASPNSARHQERKS